jgi:hypothetical protein
VSKTGELDDRPCSHDYAHPVVSEYPSQVLHEGNEVLQRAAQSVQSPDHNDIGWA